MDVSFELDSGNKVYVFPDVELKLKILKNRLTLYLGTDGGVKRNSFKRLSEHNPFITTIIPKQNTVDRWRLYGGIAASISSYVDFSISMESRNTRRMPFFVNDTSTQQNKELFNQFTVVYDDAKEVHGLAEILFKTGKRFMILLKGNYYQYTMDKEKEAWHKPQYDVSLTGKYNLQDKFLFDAGVIVYGKSYAKTYENDDVVPDEIRGFADINLGLEYRYSKNLSGFIQLNNITNNEYFRWYNYASQRFNFLIGASYAF
jgi:hypothetical protein